MAHGDGICGDDEHVRPRLYLITGAALGEAYYLILLLEEGREELAVRAQLAGAGRLAANNAGIPVRRVEEGHIDLVPYLQAVPARKLLGYHADRSPGLKLLRSYPPAFSKGYLPLVPAGQQFQGVGGHGGKVIVALLHVLRPLQVVIADVPLLIEIIAGYMGYLGVPWGILAPVYLVREAFFTDIIALPVCQAGIGAA